MKFLKKIINGIFIFPVRVYQYVISPLTPSACRYEPTCSNYMVHAIKEWGPLKGSWLGIKRFSRCHPWGSHGHDPVPLKSDKAHKKCNH